MKDDLFIALQRILPHHAFSRLVGWFAATKIRWIKHLFITKFIDAYNVNMAEALEPNPENYANFNDFFVRALKPDARPIASETNAIVSPADGAVSQLGEISGDKIFQAKNHWFSIKELLACDDALAEQFMEGSFATIYLSPSDYHRVHMPAAGQLTQMNYIPGDLFSVNPVTTENVAGLFARNERIAAIFETEFGPMAVVMVGAMIVASIETVWDGQITPTSREVKRNYYSKPRDIQLGKGDEMGRFKLGSTAVLLFPKGAIKWKEDIKAETTLRMGEIIAELQTPA